MASRLAASLASKAVAKKSRRRGVSVCAGGPFGVERFELLAGLWFLFSFLRHSRGRCRSLRLPELRVGLDQVLSYITHARIDHKELRLAGLGGMSRDFIELLHAFLAHGRCEILVVSIIGINLRRRVPQRDEDVRAVGPAVSNLIAGPVPVWIRLLESVADHLDGLLPFFAVSLPDVEHAQIHEPSFGQVHVVAKAQVSAIDEYALIHFIEEFT